MSKKKKVKEEDFEKWYEENIVPFFNKLSSMTLDERIKKFKEMDKELCAHMFAVIWETFVKKKINRYNELIKIQSEISPFKFGISHFCKSCGNDLWKQLEQSAKLNNKTEENASKHFNACGKCGFSVKNEKNQQLPKWAQLMEEALVEFKKNHHN
jgi:hypothetical protein